MLTEKEKMLSGFLYDPTDSELSAERREARNLCKRLNDSQDDEQDLREKIIHKLFGKAGESIWIEPPFFCDYGKNITLGSRVFFNFNCVILDPALVIIGDNVLFGPAVQIYTATHPMGATQRRTWLECAKPIEIGSDVWVGGGAIICPGVHLGSQSVIGAGSVVTHDIPDSVFAAGNPCRVIKRLKDDM
jgi:maltose O-acetyltransferase